MGLVVSVVRSGISVPRNNLRKCMIAMPVRIIPSKVRPDPSDMPVVCIMPVPISIKSVREKRTSRISRRARYVLFLYNPRNGGFLSRIP